MIELRLPNLGPRLRELLYDHRESVTVEAAPCSRVREVLAIWLMTRALESPKRKFLWLGARVSPVKERVREWLGGDLPDNLRFWPGNNLDTCPVDRAHDIVVAECDELPNLTSWIAMNVAAGARYVGARATKGQWFCEFPKHYVFTAEQSVLAGHATQAEIERARAGLPLATFARLYELRDLEDDDVPQLVRFNVFSRTRLSIRDKSGIITPFRQSSIQRTYHAMKTVLSHQLRKQGLPVNFLLLKYRRGGFTTEEQGESYQMCATRPNVQALTLAHTNKATAQIFRIAQLYHKKDPLAPALKGVGNASRLEFPELNSVFFIGTAAGSGEGRGDTFQRVHGSEVSKWGKGPRRNETVRDLVAGLTEAASHGEVVLETTPNGMEWFAETYREAKAKQNHWTPIFLPWFWDPQYRMPPGTYVLEELRDTVTDREADLMKRERLTWAQIAWRRMKMKSIGPLFVQEYPEDDVGCFLTVGGCYFGVSVVLDILDQIEEYDRQELPGGYVVVWEAPIAGEEYVLGADTSEGGEKSDPCGFGIMRKKTGDQVASLHGRFTPRELAIYIAAWGHKYNDALAGVERNNHGHAVILKLEELGYNTPQRQLYFAEDWKAGWNTTALTRPIMLAELREALDEGYMGVRDRQFLQECLLFVRQTNGKYAGTPDDAVMKWAICWQMRNVDPSVSYMSLPIH